MSEYDNFYREYERTFGQLFNSFIETQAALTQECLESLKKGQKTIKSGSQDSKRTRKRNAIPTIPEDEGNEPDSEDQSKEDAYQPAKRSKGDLPRESQSSRPKREASKCAAQLISHHVNLSISSKMRRPDGTDVVIKEEKVSLAPSDNKTQETQMPPPKNPPRGKRNKKKSDVLPVDLAKVKQEDQRKSATSRKQATKLQPSVSESSQDDDIEIINTSLEKLVVAVTDDESEDEHRKSLEDKSVREPTEKEESKTEKSVYEDAVQDHQDSSDNHQDLGMICTVQLEALKINPTLNETFKVSANGEEFIVNGQKLDHTIKINDLKKSENDRPVLNDTITLTKVKPNDVLFSVNDPVKKRVAAIEKLSEPEKVCRSTRTKTRAQKAAQEAKENVGDRAYDSDTDVLKTTVPKYCSRTLNDERMTPLALKPSNIVTNIESFLPKASGRKPVRTVSKDESRRKLEEDVQKKKEALLNAKVEEQKRKREEKQLKAQQARIQKEKERQIQIEKAEKEREEKQKQLNLEREQLKKEQLRKKAIADKKAQEMEERRKAEDAARLQKLNDQEDDAERLHMKRLEEEQAKMKARAQKLASEKAKTLLQKKKFGSTTPVSKIDNIPKYKTPKETVLELNSGDDSSDEQKQKVPVPQWSSKEALKISHHIPSSIPDQMFRRLFSSKPTTIDLVELFPSIDKRTCERRSTAFWRTPPRYSQVTRLME